MNISFKCTDAERMDIKACVDRAIEKYPELDRMDLTMDLTATNSTDAGVTLGGYLVSMTSTSPMTSLGLLTPLIEARESWVITSFLAAIDKED